MNGPSSNCDGLFHNGDVNNDQKLTVVDISIINAFILQTRNLTECEQYKADGKNKASIAIDIDRRVLSPHMPLSFLLNAQATSTGVLMCRTSTALPRYRVTSLAPPSPPPPFFFFLSFGSSFDMRILYIHISPRRMFDLFFSHLCFLPPARDGSRLSWTPMHAPVALQLTWQLLLLNKGRAARSLPTTR